MRDSRAELTWSFYCDLDRLLASIPNRKIRHLLAGQDQWTAPAFQRKYLTGQVFGARNQKTLNALAFGSRLNNF